MTLLEKKQELIPSFRIVRTSEMWRKEFNLFADALLEEVAKVAETTTHDDDYTEAEDTGFHAGILTVASAIRSGKGK